MQGLISAEHLNQRFQVVKWELDKELHFQGALIKIDK